MKLFSKYVLPVAVCAAEVLVGVLLLVDPAGLLGAIVAMAGIALVAAGAVWIVRYFRTAPLEAVHEQNLAKGFGSALLGVFLLLQFLWMADAVPFMGRAFGLAVLVSGVFKTQRSVDLLRLGRRFWYIAGIGAALALVAGAVVLANPFSDAFLWGFIGVCLTVVGAVDLAGVLLSGQVKEQPAAQGFVSAGQAAAVQEAAPAKPVAAADSAPELQTEPGDEA